MSAADTFSNHQTGLDGPASNAEVVTPNDGSDLAAASRGLCIGGAGALKVTMLGGQTVVIPYVPQGLLPIRVVRIWETGTTATLMTSFW